MGEKRFIRPLDVEVDKNENIQLLDTGMSFKDVVGVIIGIVAVIIPAALWLYDLKSDVNAIMEEHTSAAGLVDKQMNSIFTVIDTKAKDTQAINQKLETRIDQLGEKVDGIDQRVEEAEDSLSSIHILINKLAKPAGGSK